MTSSKNIHVTTSEFLPFQREVMLLLNSCELFAGRKAVNMVPALKASGASKSAQFREGVVAKVARYMFAEHCQENEDATYKKGIRDMAQRICDVGIAPSFSTACLLLLQEITARQSTGQAPDAQPRHALSVIEMFAHDAGLPIDPDAFTYPLWKSIASSVTGEQAMSQYLQSALGTTTSGVAAPSSSPRMRK